MACGSCPPLVASNCPDCQQISPDLPGNNEPETRRRSGQEGRQRNRRRSSQNNEATAARNRRERRRHCTESSWTRVSASCAPSRRISSCSQRRRSQSASSGSTRTTPERQVDPPVDDDSDRRRAERRRRRRMTRRRRRQQEQQQSDIGPEQEAQKCQIRQWPHNVSFVFACLSCTITTFSISKFAILAVDFGAVFIVQFLLLSLFFGIPMMTFFVSLGQYLGSGAVDMWRISPIFQGVGISLLITHSIYGLYNVVSISWIFIYLRDSFITSFDRYRWTTCLSSIKYDRNCDAHYFNGSSVRFEETIPDYFSGVVLLRASPENPTQAITGEVRFQTLFNIIVIWMAIFIALSKGLKSYGKVSCLFGFLPIAGFLVFCTKVLGMMSAEAFQDWFLSADWEGFAYNGKSWICAARECFFTWIFLGSVLTQLSSHNRFKHHLIRDTTLVAIITLIVLVLSGLLGVALLRLINQSGYEYTVSSFESSSSYEFLRRLNPVTSRHGRTLNLFPEESLSRPPGLPSPYKSPDSSKDLHMAFLAGVRIIQQGRDPEKFSGYQVMRLATELVPTYSSILGPRFLSPFWVVVFYLSLILFSIGHQLALTHTLVSAILAIRPDKFADFESAITFICCLVGVAFCFPMATELGVFIVFFFDYVIGCAWWIVLLYLVKIFAIFVVRGRPYSGENIASVLFKPKSCCSGIVTPVLVFIWSILAPIGLVVLGIISFKTGRLQEFFDWTHYDSNNVSTSFLPFWVREVGAMMQLLPLIIVPFVAVIQSFRYCFYGPKDLVEGLQLLYRPSFSRQRSGDRDRSSSGRDVVLTNYSSSSDHLAGGTRHEDVINDPPPKYTPPPSYSTATGARLARFLRQSFRESVRRIRDISSLSVPPTNQSATLSPDEETKYAGHSHELAVPPPDYATVVIENNDDSRTETSLSRTISLDTSMLASTLSSQLSETTLSYPSWPTEHTFESLDISTTNSDLPRSLGRSLVQSNSFRFASEYRPPFRRNASETSAASFAAVRSGRAFRRVVSDDNVLELEPIDAIRPTEDTYANPVPDETSDTASVLSIGEHDCQSVRNISIVVPNEWSTRRTREQRVTIDMDTTTSVI